MASTRSSNTAGTRERRVGRSIHYDISYIVQGIERGTDGAIVLLHDIPAGAFTWEPIMAQLAGLGRAVYAFDMLGYGQSEHPWPADTSIWGHADVLSMLFKSLGLTNIILVGHGLGGGVAQVLATRLYREHTSALVLVDSIAYLHAFSDNWPLTDMEKRRDFDAPQNTSVEDLVKDLRTTLPGGVVNTKGFGDVVNDYVEPWNNELGKEVLFQHLRGLVPYYLNSVSTDLQKTGKPTLLIWGQQDQQVPVQYGERLHREIPNSQLVILPNAGHMALFDDLSGIATALTNFISKL